MCKARDLPGPRGATRSSGRSPCWSPRGSSGPEPRPLNGHLPGVPGTLLTLTPTQASPVHAAQKAAPHAVAGERRPEEKPASARRAFDTWFVLPGGSHSGLPPWGGGRKGEKQKTCAHTCTLTCILTHAHTHIHTVTRTHTQTHMQAHPSAPTDTCTRRHTWILTCTDTDTRRQAHTHTHAHRHPLSHTLIHAHTDTLSHTPGETTDAGHVSARAGVRARRVAVCCSKTGRRLPPCEQASA